jgi:hypothetical protein
VAKVAVAGVEALAARLALADLGGDAHAVVHGAIGRVFAHAAGAGGEVVDIAVRDFGDGLVDDVLVGAGLSVWRGACAEQSERAHKMPNWMCLMRVGTESTTCCFACV